MVRNKNDINNLMETTTILVTTAAAAATTKQKSKRGTPARKKNMSLNVVVQYSFKCNILYDVEDIENKTVMRFDSTDPIFSCFLSHLLCVYVCHCAYWHFKIPLHTCACIEYTMTLRLD